MRTSLFKVVTSVLATFLAIVSWNSSYLSKCRRKKSLFNKIMLYFMLGEAILDKPNLR